MRMSHAIPAIPELLLPLAAMMVAVGIYPKWALLLFSATYLVSAPATYVWGLLARSLSAESEGIVDESALR